MKCQIIYVLGGESINMKKAIKFIVIAVIVGVLVSAAYQLYGSNAQEDEDSNEEDFMEAEKASDSLQSEELQDEDEKISLIDSKDSGNTIDNDVSTIVDNVMPSIVAINLTVEDTVTDFFGREYSQESEGSGSGFIIGQNEKELLIATNNHVIADAVKIEIVFNDGESAEGTLRGSNAVMDVAVVCVNIDDLSKETQDNIKIATIGNSDNVGLGDLSIAIGNALGYGQSVTVGYISAVNREVDVEGRTMKLIQTDAAINPGNSGGALLNARGEVIGINTMKLVSEDVEGIGYAIPISEVLDLINHLINREVVSEGNQAYLGIKTQDITQMYSQGFNMPLGVFVSEVEEDSAASEAGVNGGDIITAINGMPIESQLDLIDVLNYTGAGSKGTITVSSLDNGEYVERTLDIVFGEQR